MSIRKIKRLTLKKHFAVDCNSEAGDFLEFQDILNAQENLKSVLFSTPLITVPDIQEYALYIKPENLQRTGSFKIRGAYNKICLLDEEEKARGVITSSAGNHAQGVAFAAREKNIHAVVCMPKSTPEVKVEATRRYGAASYAALLAGYLPLAGRKVAVVLSGGNIDLSLFSRLMTQEE